MSADMRVPTQDQPLSDTRVAQDLIRELGADAVLGPDQDLSRYVKDWSGDHHGKVLAVLKPITVTQTCRAVCWCAQNGIPVIPQGGHTGLVGGAIDPTGGAVVVSLERLNQIRDINPTNLTATVDAGCVLQTVKDAVAAQNCFFPVSLGAEGSCQIGGIVATNAGGSNVVKYGMTRNNIMGLEVVLPDGTLWTSLAGLRKDNCGPDLTQLFIGSEGAFGIVTAACLKLSPALKIIETAYVGCASFDNAMALLQTLRSENFEFLSGFEVISNTCLPLAKLAHANLRLPVSADHPVHILIELSAVGHLPLRSMLEDFLAIELDNGRINDAVVAQNLTQAGAFWKIREGLVQGHAINGFHVRSDVSVRLEKIPELITQLQSMLASRFPSWTAQVYGHAGDGNIHFNALPPPAMDDFARRKTGANIEAAIFAIVDALDGSFSAEHGIGRSKRDYFTATADKTKLRLLTDLKNAVDVSGLMNPNCLIPQQEVAK